MGGRGGSSGRSGGGIGGGAGGGVATGAGGQGQASPNLQSLINSMINANYQKRRSPGLFHDGEGSAANDYTDYNNPNLVKWQNADDTKSARYLAHLGKMQTPASDAEGYAYHQSAFQNMVIEMDLNKPVYASLSKSDFDTYCQQAGVQSFYRGWSSSASRSRFEKAAANHTGAGMYGEGTYFGDYATAMSYKKGRNSITEAALSPNARVIDITTLQSAINRVSPTMQRALTHSGYTPTSQYASNNGEAQMALKMGYNVIRTSWSYVVLSRDALVIRK